jgi:4'-phosphopantetheinyl transferase
MTDRSPISVGFVEVSAVPQSELDALRLSDADAARSARFTRAGDRTRFLVSRWLVGRTAATAIGVRPGDVTMRADPLGAPILGGAANGWSVSLAHSVDLAVVAIAEVAVGVDVEGDRDRALHPDLEARISSPTELGRLTRLTGPARRAAFLRVWTRKEAYGKAIGVGLDFPLRTVTAGPDGVRIGGIEDRYFVTDLDLAAGYTAALVSIGRRRQVDVVQLAGPEQVRTARS